ncbi:hypothetical protein GF325_10360 [Candidatus Bathyarchaeota archaeon]|nr:hypothetical protein [Candidatus Bathyarchaeota archaeon]
MQSILNRGCTVVPMARDDTVVQDSLKKQLQAGRSVTGIMVQDLVEPVIIPLLEACGFDFVVVDREHGPASFNQLQRLALVAKEYRIALLVRPTVGSYECIARVMDMGADGVMVPHVDTPSQAKEVIDAVKYPPVGKRGYGMRKFLSKWGDGMPSPSYVTRANEEIVVFIQVETPGAVTRASEMIEMDHVDGIIVGPADLTLNMGLQGQYQHPRFEKHMEDVLDACKEAGKHGGAHFGSADLALSWKHRGMNILMVGNVKGLIARQGRELVTMLQDEKNTGNETGDPGIY